MRSMPPLARVASFGFALLIGLTAAAEPHAPRAVPQLAGVYDGVHRDWRDSVTLNADGTYARGSGDPGTWTFDGHTLVLLWAHWGPEPLTYVSPGVFEATDRHFRITQRNPPDYREVIGTFEGVHHDWRDTVTFNADGTYSRGNGDPGTWLFDGRTLVLYWSHWGVNFLDMRRPGHFASSAEAFELRRGGPPEMHAPPNRHEAVRDERPFHHEMVREQQQQQPPFQHEMVREQPQAPPPPVDNSSRLVRTSHRFYKAGEDVQIDYFGMPGNSTDWVTVAKSGEATDAWGNWEYTNGTAAGTRVVKNLAPGDYEARVYFSNGTDLQDRISFTVR